MIDIEIRPAFGAMPGRLSAEGHAKSVEPGEFDPVCCAVTAHIGGLQSNLERCFGVYCKAASRNGFGMLAWGRNRKGKQGALDRANRCAGYAYNALKDLEKEYPQALRVRWKPAAPMEELE